MNVKKAIRNLAVVSTLSVAALPASAFELNIGKALGLESSGVGEHFIELVTGNRTLARTAGHIHDLAGNPLDKVGQTSSRNHAPVPRRQNVDHHSQGGWHVPQVTQYSNLCHINDGYRWITGQMPQNAPIGSLCHASDAYGGVINGTVIPWN